MLNGLKIQFNLNKCIVKICDCEAIVIALREHKLYEINFVKLHKEEATNLVQALTRDGAFRLWLYQLGHLNVKGDLILQNMVSDTNLDNFTCPTSSLLCEVYIENKQHKIVFPNKRGGE